MGQDLKVHQARHLQIHFTDKNTQIHKYTNTQIHKYTNTKIQKYKTAEIINSQKEVQIKHTCNKHEFYVIPLREGCLLKDMHAIRSLGEVQL